MSDAAEVEFPDTGLYPPAIVKLARDAFDRGRASAQVVPQPNREALAEVAYRAWCDARRGGPMDPAEYEAIRSRVEFEWMHGVVDAVLAALSPAPLTIDREALSALLLRLLYPPKFAGSSWTFNPGAAADAVIAYLSAQPVAGEAEWGIRWEDGKEVSWHTREAAEYELRGTYPNMIGKLIRRDVRRGPWIEVQP